MAAVYKCVKGLNTKNGEKLRKLMGNVGKRINDYKRATEIFCLVIKGLWPSEESGLGAPLQEE